MVRRTVAVLVLAVVLMGAGSGVAQADTWTRRVDTAACSGLVGQPAYGWTNPDGSKVRIPAGRKLLKELSDDGYKFASKSREAACRVLRAEYWSHRR